ncbi:Pyridine nucleotide-disulfide oxidoreductase domain-containing protein 1 [Fasciola gigantica]|uniref:Pyridine nucleotide-disulfide oxidoreductase domain-containing protein 1 n=1 Tax=Fasciola gigantica TaxID=46835 RepID=A0A504Y9T4_FASGI|nr:Pyridine nucleotide-disulfide oxidoreductase domain-containing protein 1 [Fasciola gigantica]
MNKLLIDRWILIVQVVYKVRIHRLLTPTEFRESGLRSINPFPDQADFSDDWPVFVELTNGEVYGCDLIVSAVGVEASFQPVSSTVSRTSADFFGTLFDLAPASAGGGVLVDDQMQTSVPDVYAAGDCAFANWTWAPHWIQMRLWSQARQMGFQAAKAMFGHATGERLVPLDFTFELFTHVTYFFGFKVVLLGLFNGQGLDLTSPDCYLLMRVTPGEEYVKCVMQSGRMQGALLIGETDLEETLENLIVNQLDLINLEDSLLDPNIDLGDYFD